MHRVAFWFAALKKKNPEWIKHGINCQHQTFASQYEISFCWMKALIVIDSFASPRGNDANMGKCYLGCLISCKRLPLFLSEANDWWYIGWILYLGFMSVLFSQVWAECLCHIQWKCDLTRVPYEAGERTMDILDFTGDKPWLITALGMGVLIVSQAAIISISTGLSNKMEPRESGFHLLFNIRYYLPCNIGWSWQGNHWGLFSFTEV